MADRSIRNRWSCDACPFRPAEAFDLLETLHPSDAERAATVEALKEALEDMRGGDTGIPARDFFTDLRSKYNLPARS
jgi:hypothetical protein